MFVFQTLRKWVRNHTGIVLGEEMGQKSYREIAFGDSQLTEDQEASPSCSCSHAAVPRTKNRRGRNKFKKIFTKKTQLTGPFQTPETLPQTRGFASGASRAWMAGLLLPPLRRRVLPARTGACAEKTPANLRECM